MEMAKLREWFYTFTALAGYSIPVLVAFGFIGDAKSTALMNLLAVIGTVTGTGSATAAVKINKQRKDGTFDKKIPSPVEVIGGLQEIQAQINGQIDEARDRAAGAMADVISLATDKLPGGDLVSQILRGKP